jgi:MarR family transcriptional regulator, organic hydroperoxide resistance regulator
MTKPATLDTSLTSWIGRIRKALRREFEARASGLDITASQLQVLRRLWEGDGILTSTLTRDVASDGGTITGVLDRLESKGLIRRQRSLEDRRAVHVSLTPAGRELEAPLTGMIGALNGQALEGFTPEESAALIRALERIGKNLGA